MWRFTGLKFLKPHADGEHRKVVCDDMAALPMRV